MVKPTNNRLIDTTNYPDNTTIYVDATNFNFNSAGWRIKKLEGQTIVINIPGRTVNLYKELVTVCKRDANGNLITIVNDLDSNTNGNGGSPSHNTNVENYILNHVVINAYEATQLNLLNGPAGLFLATYSENTMVEEPQGTGSGTGWIATKGTFKNNNGSEWHFFRTQRNYKAYAETGVNIAKIFTYQDGSDLDSDKRFKFHMYEVDGTNFQKLTGNVGHTIYDKVVESEAADKIEFPSFGISNTDFPHDNHGKITGDSKIYRYYVIEENPDPDQTIVTDPKKIYVKVEARGYNNEQIDLSIQTSKDHVNWTNAGTGAEVKVGTFNNYKKQYTDIEVEKKWQQAVYNGSEITYTDTTGSHTTDSVEVSLIAVKSPLQQGQGGSKSAESQQIESTSTSQESAQTSTTQQTETTSTATETAKPANCVITFNPQKKISDASISLSQGKTYTITVKLNNAGAPFSIKEGGRTVFSKNQTNESGNKYLTFEYTVPNSASVTWDISDEWWAVVKISGALKGSTNVYRTIKLIAANGISDISFSPATSVTSVQNGLKSVAEITNNQEYTVVDTQTLSKKNNWKYKWNNLPQHLYEDDGTIYTLTYYVVETSATGAASNSYKVDGKTTTITNIEEETSATVQKVWDDADNQDGIRPANLTVDLMDENGKVTSVVLNAGNSWKATVDHLLKYRNGNEITYSWNETNLPQGYSMSTPTKNGEITTLTNSHTPAKTSLTLTKTWADGRQQYFKSHFKINCL